MRGCAVEVKGLKGGCRPAAVAAKIDAVRTACLEGRSLAALARDHGVTVREVSTATVFAVTVGQFGSLVGSWVGAC